MLDTSDDPDMAFDELGRCQYYHDYVSAERAQVRTGEAAREELERVVARIKRDGRRRRYDCILGVSGGVDSTYLAYLARQHGLRVLAVHFDNGWNSELAVKNIENVISRLGFDLYTYVVDWDEFRDLQLAYLKASVVDIEAITDHAILATMYRIAAKERVRHILSGANVVTEHVMPKGWIFNKYDHKNILAIHGVYGTITLKTFPLLDWKAKKYYRYGLRIQFHPLLNLVPYDKAQVKTFIERELGWRDYGGKHCESIFTRFYQGYILLEKFGIDKRKAHLSNLIFSGQITREEALVELEMPGYDSRQLREDRTFVLKKLGLTEETFASLMRRSPRAHTEFDVERSIYEAFPLLGPLRRLRERILH